MLVKEAALSRLLVMGLDALGPKTQKIAIIIVSGLLLWGCWIIFMHMTEDLTNFSEAAPIIFTGTGGIYLVFAIGYTIYTFLR